jgi:hypothetical protein
MHINILWAIENRKKYNTRCLFNIHVQGSGLEAFAYFYGFTLNVV